MIRSCCADCTYPKIPKPNSTGKQTNTARSLIECPLPPSSQNECYFASGRIVGAGAARSEMPYPPLVASASPAGQLAAHQFDGSSFIDHANPHQPQQPPNATNTATALGSGGATTTLGNDGAGNPNSSSSTSSTTAADIQLHLQSMFDLLRKEETLKMAVKLETARTGRTRYLVVVTRPATCHVQQQQPQQPQQDVISTSNSTGAGGMPNADEHSCEASALCNSSEESCLLGIDCNEKTTVGLVLRILADTTIRMDGDGYVVV